MGKQLRLLKQLKRMLKECDRDKRLEERLKPWIEQAEHEGVTFETIPAFIKEYNKAKKELGIR